MQGNSASYRKLVSVLFFISGFCGLLYQTIWVRLAYASFGIITPVMSVVISVFMLGLALGSWAGGRWIDPLRRRTGVSGARFYALTEFLVGLSAFAVPRLFAIGQKWLLPFGEMNSAVYLLLSAAILAVSILPWCVLMGTTFPFMMAFLEEVDGGESSSFSFLYVANVLGSLTGVAVTVLVLIEAFGFRATLMEAGAGNFYIAAVAFYLGARRTGAVARRAQAAAGLPSSADSAAPAALAAAMVFVILFTTGFASMAMEVVWVRAFLPVLGTQVYSFAAIVFIYLLATLVGSLLYRRDLARGKVHSAARLLGALSVFALLPVLLNDPRLHAGVLGVFVSIFPVCGTLGYLTPQLIDRYSLGRPDAAGAAYAVNVCGCILGPLAASYLIVPFISARAAMAILSASFLALFAAQWKPRSPTTAMSVGAAVASVAGLLAALFLATSYEEGTEFTPRLVRRDHAATVISAGDGREKVLLINGQVTTLLLQQTKLMAHLPLAIHGGKPRSALVICFGMGTSFRSAMSWEIPTTAVELVPSVTAAFGYYYADADALRADPRAKVVVDDGRRFLRRTGEKFDVVIIDPPPPVEAAGSSLLYSREFYAALKERLNPGAVVQQWYPGGRDAVLRAVVRSTVQSFPFVWVIRSIAGRGYHILASMAPLVIPSPKIMADRMPAKAQRDLLEWYPGKQSPEYLAVFLTENLSGGDDPIQYLDPDPTVVVSDDRPFNEYYLLRKARHFLGGRN